jgi:transposase
MYNLHTEKQRRYFSEVIRLHYEEGYGEDRIAKIIPIGHSTVSRWIAIFAKEKGKVTMARNSHKVQAVSVEQSQSAEIRELQKKVKELEKQLLEAEIKAEAYDELINVAEAKFRIPIRKKAGATQ